MYDSPIAPLFHMYKIKYIELRDLLIDECIGLKRHSPIDLYINLEMILRRLTQQNVIEYLTVSRESKHLELVSHLINLAGHYRKFFTGNKHPSRIVFYMPWDLHARYDNQQYLPSYRSRMRNRFDECRDRGVLLQTLENVIPLTQMILEYIDQVYLITSDTMEPSLIPYIVDKEKPYSAIKLLLTDDVYDYQYLEYGFQILNASKQGHWLANIVTGTEYMKRRARCFSSTHLDLAHIPFLLSLTGDKRRSIPNIPGYQFSKALKVLQKGKDNLWITKDTDDINLLTLTIPDNIVQATIQNHMVIDLEKQYERFASTYSWKVLQQMKDRFDNTSLRELADRYFMEYPIMVYEMNNYYPSATRNAYIFG